MSDPINVWHRGDPVVGFMNEQMDEDEEQRMEDRTEGGEEGEEGIWDNNTFSVPKLTENPGATTRPVTTLQMAALELALISSSSERGHHPLQNASKLARGDARLVSVLPNLLRRSIFEYSMKDKK